MATVTIRNLPDDVHRAIRVRAAQHGRSTEAEIREILARSVHSEGRLKIGTELRRFAESIGGVELDLRRATAPMEPASFD
jgi:plasmid stability protein